MKFILITQTSSQAVGNLVMTQRRKEIKWNGLYVPIIIETSN